MVVAVPRRRRRVLTTAAALLLPLIAEARCDLLPRQQAVDEPQRLVAPEDLVRLRDIGLPDGSILGWPSPLGLSPDGTRAAFVISRADPDTNRYCRGLAVIDIKPAATPRLLDEGGDPILSVGVYRGLLARTGFPQVVTPLWSPDGRWIAYLRRDRGTTQLWLVALAGGPGHPLTRSAVDVERFAWLPDGTGLVFASRTGILAERSAADSEARRGFHYDERFVPSMGNSPQPSASTPLEYFKIGLADRELSPASASERERISAEGVPGVPPDPRADAPDGRRAWTERQSSSPLGPLVLRATAASGATITCPPSACSGKIVGMWWLPGGGPLLFLQREGWARGEMALYRWTPGAGPPKRVFATTDILDGCLLSGVQLICTREAAITPRRLVSVDPRTGKSRLLYDPNPEFSRLRLGRVVRLFWKNDLGLEARGDLVLPPGYRPGTRLPLIVTQYFSNGFLRGATGDEYPIHAFAARGFAVLSIERPPFFAAANPALKTYEDINAANARGWSERRSLLSAVTTGVQRVIDLGVADPARIGITGLSDGASTVAFGLINTDRFAAAVMSSCCIEPWTVMTVVGPAYADRMRTLGYPPATASDRSFWAPASIAQNAAAIDTPLLMQLADDEYLTSLEAFTALREHGKPVDMYVFPGEHHIKWQPAHRLAIYARNLDWFGFWLAGSIDPDPEKREEFARWQAMRDRRDRARVKQ